MADLSIASVQQTGVFDLDCTYSLSTLIIHSVMTTVFERCLLVARETRFARIN